MNTNMKLSGLEPTNEILGEIGNRIRQLRISMNITQGELARRADISAHTLSNLENGLPVKTDTLTAVMRELKCAQNLDLLIPDEEELRPSEIIAGREQKQRERVGRRRETEWKWGE